MESKPAHGSLGSMQEVQPPPASPRNVSLTTARDETSRGLASSSAREVATVSYPSSNSCSRAAATESERKRDREITLSAWCSLLAPPTPPPKSSPLPGKLPAAGASPRRQGKMQSFTILLASSLCFKLGTRFRCLSALFRTMDSL